MGCSAAKEKDFPIKYHAYGNWQQLQVGAFGTCIAPSQLPATAKARSGGINNLTGITSDGTNIYKYFVANGAYIAKLEFSVPARPAYEVRESVKKFIMSPGNNKFLYFSGHGDGNGDLVLGSGSNARLQVSDVFDWLNEAKFCGHITIMVDACFSGKWANRLIARINDNNMEGVAEYGRLEKNKKSKSYINLRLSSLANETSNDTHNGGCYTLQCLRSLRQEYDWTPSYTGEGWGTKIFNNRKPDGDSVCWGTEQSEPQTDIAVDFVCQDGQWKWYYPESRGQYLVDDGHRRGQKRKLT